MQTRIHEFSRPIFYDAFEVGKRLGFVAEHGQNKYWNTGEVGHRVMSTANALSLMPCSFTPIRAFTFDEMFQYATSMIKNQAVNHKVFGNRYDGAVHDFSSVVSLMKPTIKAFLYAHYIRSFGAYDAGCLDLKQETYIDDRPTLDFLNSVDKYFFESLVAEIGLDGDTGRFQGFNSFFTYK
jgi:hypothetical protein